MYKFRTNPEKEKSAARPLTPLSNCSSNHENLFNESGGLKGNFGLLTMQKANEEDFLRHERIYGYSNRGENIAIVLELLEHELKKVDYSFEFNRIDESLQTGLACIREAAAFLSSKSSTIKKNSAGSDRRLPINIEMCSSCMKMKNLMDEAKFSIEREKESLENTEKHLKHYDSLLAIKENRLREQELSFENERNLLEIQKSEICREKVLLEKEKESFTSNLGVLHGEKENLEKQMQQLEKKYQDVKAILNDYEGQKSNIESSIKGELAKSLEIRENQLKQKESEMARQIEDLKSKQKIFEKSYFDKQNQADKLKQDLISKQKELAAKKYKISMLKKQLNESSKAPATDIDGKLKEIAEKEEMLKSKSDEIASIYMKINEEKSRLEVLRRSLQEEKEDLDQELLNTRRTCHEKIMQAQMAEERFKERLTQTENKEKRLEDMIKALQEEEQKLEERWKNVENMQMVSQELRDFKEKYMDLQKSYNLQQLELNNLKYKTCERPLQLSPNIKERIEMLKQKEEELIDFENQLKKEREEIDISAALIRQLNEDLEKQKILQNKERKRLDELSKELKNKENSLSHIEISHLDIKNSSSNSMHRILVSDMSPFDEREALPFTHDG